MPKVVYYSDRVAGLLCPWLIVICGIFLVIYAAVVVGIWLCAIIAGVLYLVVVILWLGLLDKNVRVWWVFLFAIYQYFGLLSLVFRFKVSAICIVCLFILTKIKRNVDIRPIIVINFNMVPAWLSAQFRSFIMCSLLIPLLVRNWRFDDHMHVIYLLLESRDSYSGPVWVGHLILCYFSLLLAHNKF